MSVNCSFLFKEIEPDHAPYHPHHSPTKNRHTQQRRRLLPDRCAGQPLSTFFVERSGIRRSAALTEKKLQCSDPFLNFLLPASSSDTPTQTHTIPTGTIPPRHLETTPIVSQQSNCGVTSYEKKCATKLEAHRVTEKKRMCTRMTEKHESREQERTQTVVENVGCGTKEKQIAHVASVCSASVLR